MAVGSAGNRLSWDQGVGLRGPPRPSGLNFLPTMLLWRRETGGTWGWFLCASLRSGIGWGKGRELKGQ